MFQDLYKLLKHHEVMVHCENDEKIYFLVNFYNTHRNSDLIANLKHFFCIPANDRESTKAYIPNFANFEEEKRQISIKNYIFFWFI